jgi:poly(3-hydroxybutyrate) depolymerase
MNPELLVLSMLLALGGCGEAASEGSHDDVRRVVTPEPPCAKCTLDAPAIARGPLPLLVVLHGNHEDAATAAKRWNEIAIERGFAVLALHCPRDAGCADGKWYRWASTPAWVQKQVTKLSRDLVIDPSRTYLAGWSGGASAIGMHAPAWDRMFAAVVIHGGGQAPLGSDACPERPLPAYFLVGDENPAHPAAKRLRDYYRRCGQDITWDLLPGADHSREDRALDRDKAAQIIDWLEAHARRPNVS